MTEKRRCPNCGAYLSNEDSTCYVCGKEVDLENTQPNDTNEVVFEPKEKEDYVTPVNYDGVSSEYEDSTPLSDDDYAEPNDDYSEPEKEKGSKKVLIVCIIIVVAALIGAGVFCFASGMFDSKEEEAVKDDKMSLFFDKPSDAINLFDAEKKVYNWNSDVVIWYTVNGKETKKGCTVNNEYKNLWEVEIPDNAVDVRFTNTENTIKTETISEPEDGMVYYVEDAYIGNSGIVLKCCDISDFKNFGINYDGDYKPETESAKPTETSTATETTESESETSTETVTEKTDTDYYTVSLPDEWRHNAVDIEKEGNTTIYYDNYNHRMYGMGMLFAVYVYDANDSSYKEKKFEKAIPSSDGKKVVVVECPSGIEFEDSDKDAVDSYMNLRQYTSDVINSITVK